MKNLVSLSLDLNDDKLVLLKNFTKKDVNEIATIEKDIAVTPWSIQNFLNSVLSSHICVGLQQNGRWIAYAVFSLAAGEAELLILGVVKSQQKHGYASLLLNHMEKYLSQHVSEIFLEVRASNSAAINLYEKLGYGCLGERKNYYPGLAKDKKRENALIYGKHISFDS